MQWDSDQSAALLKIREWLKEENTANSNYQQVFRLFGYAGTGKTTIAKEIYNEYHGTLGAAYTGKATMVMRSKGIDAHTIHSLIYVPQQNPSTGAVSYVKRSKHGSLLANCKLILLDEVSQVNEELARDLLSFGIKILVLGDPFQLPPVEGAGYFVDQNVTPDVMLTKIHRQARDNPIIRLSMKVRKGKSLSAGKYGESEIIARRDFQQNEKEYLESHQQLIVGLNKTRQLYNNKIRELMGIDYDQDLPVKNEKLVCLQNDRASPLLNGSLWNVDKVGKPRQIEIKGHKRDGSEYVMTYPSDHPKKYQKVMVTAFPVMVSSLDMPGEIQPFKKFVPVNVFYREDMDWRQKVGLGIFDFGYALTCHKSQGSQFDSVLVLNESYVFGEDSQRWLYTALTRAITKVTIAV